MAILCLVAPACRGGTDGGGAETRTTAAAGSSAEAATTAAAAPSTTSAAGSSADGTTTAPASATPLSISEWYHAYEFWLEDLRQAVTKSGLALSSLGGTRRVTEADTVEEELLDLGRTIEAVGECVEFKRTLLPAPRKVRAAAAVLYRSCERFRRGAELATAALEKREKELYAAAAVEWRGAAALVASGNRRLPAPMPTEALPLQVEGGRTNASRVEPLLSDIANTDLPGEYVVAVRCWSGDDWRRILRGELGRMDIAGYTPRWIESANLAPFLCRPLTAVAYANKRPHGRAELVLAFAAMVLMHEAAHVLDEIGYVPLHAPREADATCYGMQHIRTVVHGLGMSKRYAARLAGRFWREIYPSVPRRYQSPKCRNGGKFDIRLGADAWP